MQEEDLERIHRPFFVWLACQKGISEGESRRGTFGGSKTCKKEGATDTPSSQGASSFFCSQKRKEEKVNPPIFFVPGRFGGGKSLLIRKSRSDPSLQYCAKFSYLRFPNLQKGEERVPAFAFTPRPSSPRSPPPLFFERRDFPKLFSFLFSPPLSHGLTHLSLFLPPFGREAAAAASRKTAFPPPSGGPPKTLQYICSSLPFQTQLSQGRMQLLLLDPPPCSWKSGRSPADLSPFRANITRASPSFPSSPREGTTTAYKYLISASLPSLTPRSNFLFVKKRPYRRVSSPSFRPLLVHNSVCQIFFCRFQAAIRSYGVPDEEIFQVRKQTFSKSFSVSVD